MGTSLSRGYQYLEVRWCADQLLGTNSGRHVRPFASHMGLKLIPQRFCNALRAPILTPIWTLGSADRLPVPFCTNLVCVCRFRLLFGTVAPSVPFWVPISPAFARPIFKFFDIFEKVAFCFLIRPYIQKITLNLITKPKTLVHDTKNTQNTQLHFPKSKFFKNPYFQKLEIHSNQCFPLIFRARLWRA